MTLADAVLRLPRDVGQLVYAFLFAPLSQAHPERLPLPQSLADTGHAANVAAWGVLHPGDRSLAAGETAWHGQIDWRSPIHRLAMLPRNIIEALSWYLGLAVLGDRLRRVVIRDELLALQAAGVSAQHLDFVYSLPAVAAVKSPAAAPLGSGVSPALSADLVWQAGWQALQSGTRSLPESLARRLSVKCPAMFDAGPEGTAAAVIEPALFLYVRDSVVSSWNAGFDSALEAITPARS